MEDFHTRLKRLIAESEYDYKSLSLEVGQGERYISNLLSNKSDPGYTTVLRLCSALGVTPNQLTGLDDALQVTSPFQPDIVQARAERMMNEVLKEAQSSLLARGIKPSVDDMLLWWHQQDGVLANFDQIARVVDLFDRPDAGSRMPLPYYTGSESTLSRAFGVESADHLRKLQDSFNPQVCERIVVAHNETSKGEPRLSVEDIEVMIPGNRFPARFKYRRLLLPVRDTAGRSFILNYSQTLE